MWNLSRLAYYADFVTIPFLAIVALISDVWYHGVTVAMLGFLVLGFLLWTFMEYAIHRWLFHHVFRREHWFHHTHPAAYSTLPASWQTGLVALAALSGCLGEFGLDIGAGLFAGIAAGYILYLWAHDRFHHGPIPLPDTYWFNRMCAHDIHHSRGIEANFAVVSPFWDVIFKTYLPS